MSTYQTACSMERVAHKAYNVRQEEKLKKAEKSTSVFFQQMKAFSALFPGSKKTGELMGPNGLDHVIVRSPDNKEHARIWFVKNQQLVTYAADCPELCVDGSHLILFYKRRVHPYKQREKLIDEIRQRLVKRAAQRASKQVVAKPKPVKVNKQVA